MFTRFIALCIFLTTVVIAFGCNSKSQTTGTPGPQPQGRQEADPVGEPLPKSEAEAKPLEATATDAEQPAAPAATPDPAPEAAVEPSAAKTEPEPSATGKTEEKPAAQPATAAPQSVERVKLGSPELTAGLPGEGPLSLEQIQTWLDDPRNHATLEVELPMGLSAGAQSIKIPADNPLTRAKIELGRQLYFERRLSSDGTISCADCHHPDEGYARHTQFGVGVDGQTGERNSPTSYNRILSGPQFWDGRADSLEAQAVGPIANPIEMANTHEAAVSTLKKIEGYRIQFAKIFGDVTIDNVGKAIASFERAIVTGPSPFDFYERLRAMQKAFKDDLEDLAALKEDDPDLYDDYMRVLEASQKHAISASAIRGRDIFFTDRGRCSACHVGANLTDEKYDNLGVGMSAEKPDLGRFAVTKEEQDRGAFKTPTIRNVALTAPYMHDGSQKTLEEVVAWYAKGGHPNPQLSKDIKKLDLTAQDQADLVAFMKACTGPFPQVEMERLPE